MSVDKRRRATFRCDWCQSKSKVRGVSNRAGKNEARARLSETKAWLSQLIKSKNEKRIDPYRPQKRIDSNQAVIRDVNKCQISC